MLGGGIRRARRRHQAVLALEPSRSASTIGYGLLATAALVVSIAGFARPNVQEFGDWNPHEVFKDNQRAILAGGAIVLLLSLIATYVNGRRWLIAHGVKKLSIGPLFARDPLPPSVTGQSHRRPANPEPLAVRVRRPRENAPPRRRQVVTSRHNVVGRRPLNIAYLRLFENQPRTRTFLQGAVREFGYVHLLRSAASVTPAEYRMLKRSGDGSEVLLSSREDLLAVLSRYF